MVHKLMKELGDLVNTYNRDKLVCKIVGIITAICTLIFVILSIINLKITLLDWLTTIEVISGIISIISIGVFFTMIMELDSSEYHIKLKLQEIQFQKESELRYNMMVDNIKKNSFY